MGLREDYSRYFETRADYSLPEGWFCILDDFLFELIKLGEKDFKISQVKEKFGELRIYGGPHNEYIAELIEQATKRSANTCQECGQSGYTRDIGGWLKTVCENHVR